MCGGGGAVAGATCGGGGAARVKQNIERRRGFARIKGKPYSFPNMVLCTFHIWVSIDTRFCGLGDFFGCKVVRGRCIIGGSHIYVGKS